MAQPKMAVAQDGIWLPLVEYSIKSGLSLSTIRRKIKSNSLPYRLDKGKYFLLFDGPVADFHAGSEERVRELERRNVELEEQLQELRLLVKVLEEKYEVHY